MSRARAFKFIANFLKKVIFKRTGMSEPSIKEKVESTTTGSKQAFNKEQLISTVQTLQFAWFIGHVITLIGVFYFTITYVGIGKKYYWIWYILALLGVVESFGILVFQLVKKQGFNVNVLKKDDNVHFFVLGLLFLILRPYIIFPILPFQLFSLFHVLSYAKSYLFPIFNIGESSAIYKQVDSFITKNNGKSIQLAGLLEVVSLFFLGFRVLLFRKRSLTPFLIYLIFMKLRFEKSVVTRNNFKIIEVKIDDTVNSLGNPNVKDIWIKVKGVFNKIGSTYLVNDYTKDKVQ